MFSDCQIKILHNFSPRRNKSMKRCQIARYSTLFLVLISANPLCAKNGYAQSDEIGTNMVAKIKQELKEPLLTLLSTTEYASPQELERRVNQAEEAIKTFKAGFGIQVPASPTTIPTPTQVSVPATSIVPITAPTITTPQPVSVIPAPPVTEPTPDSVTPTTPSVEPTPAPLTVPVAAQPEITAQQEPIQIPTPEPIILPTPSAPETPVSTAPEVTEIANVPAPEPAVETSTATPEVTVPTAPTEVAPAPTVQIPAPPTAPILPSSIETPEVPEPSTDVIPAA